MIHEILKLGARALFAVEEHGIEELTKARYNICSTRCQLFLPGVNKCGDCGCYMEEKTKLLTNRNLRGEIEVTDCPKHFWDEIHKEFENQLFLVESNK